MDNNNDKKYAIVPVSTLKALIENTQTLFALQEGGVDNWQWYGESLKEYFSREVADYSNNTDACAEVADKLYKEWIEDQFCIEVSAQEREEIKTMVNPLLNGSHTIKNVFKDNRRYLVVDDFYRIDIETKKASILYEEKKNEPIPKYIRDIAGLI